MHKYTWTSSLYQSLVGTSCQFFHHGHPLSSRMQTINPHNILETLRPWDPNRIGVVDVCCSWSFVGTMCAWCFSDESLWTPCKFTLITPPLLWLYWWFYVALLNEWHTRQWCWRIRTAPLSFSPALYNGNEWKPSGATGVKCALLSFRNIFCLFPFGIWSRLW